MSRKLVCFLRYKSYLAQIRQLTAWARVRNVRRPDTLRDCHFRESREEEAYCCGKMYRWSTDGIYFNTARERERHIRHYVIVAQLRTTCVVGVEYGWGLWCRRW